MYLVCIYNNNNNINTIIIVEFRKTHNIKCSHSKSYNIIISYNYLTSNLPKSYINLETKANSWNIYIWYYSEYEIDLSFDKYIVFLHLASRFLTLFSKILHRYMDCMQNYKVLTNNFENQIKYFFSILLRYSMHLLRHQLTTQHLNSRIY